MNPAGVLFPEFTERQYEMLLFINTYRSREQCNPTCNEIAQHFGWSSANASNDILKLLERKGAIEYRPGQKARGYRVLRTFENLKFQPEVAT